MTLDIFTETGITPRRQPRVMMHVTDAGMFPDGKAAIKFKCNRCEHDTGWIYDTDSVSQNKRGRPCPECNAK